MADSLPQAARHAPATLRNREAIAAVIQNIFKAPCDVLEIASGSGEHAMYFSAIEPGWTWHPSDHDADALASIEAWRQSTDTPMKAPIHMDVCNARWHKATPHALPSFGAVFCANMIHIAPPQATQGLIKTVAAQLKPHGDFVLYGPFMMAGRHTAPSNAGFDGSLKSRNPAWGLRDLGEVIESARQHQLVHQETYTMPANNLCVHFKRSDHVPLDLTKSRERA